MYSSHTYHLKDSIDIFFTDSGPPPGSTDYTTLIVLHGSAFTGNGFIRLHSYAHSDNLRILLLNRRDYPGSTEYTDAELDDLSHNPKVFLDRLAIQLADFIKQFAEKENVPSISADRKSGGFAIMGWSMGTATAMSLFSDRELYTEVETYGVLEKYVKDLVLYEPPHLSFGIQLSEEHEKVAYHPWTDPDCKTPEELYQNFTYWVSSYFDHPAMAIGTGEPGTGTTSGDIDYIHGLDYRKRTDRVTVATFTHEELEEFYCESAAVRSELKMYVEPMQTTLRNLTDRVLFNTFNNDNTITTTGPTNMDSQIVLPKVPITYIAASRSSWHCILAYFEIRKRYEELQQALEAEGKGNSIRPIHFFNIKEGNHFVHWDQPTDLIDAIVQGSRL